MLRPSGSQTPSKAKPTDLHPCHQDSHGTCVPATALRWASTRHFLFSAIALLIVALTTLSRSPQCVSCHLFASSALKDVFPLSDLETILRSELDASRAAEWSYYFTSQSHFPGEGKAQGLWTKKKWEEFGIPETDMVTYNASISAPVFQRLALIDMSESPSSSVMYEAKLMEELPPNDTSKIRTPAFHGQSSSGNVTAQFVYANFGREQDYHDLEQNHVDVKGKIAIVKYGMVWRGAKMSNAAKRGLVGIVIYPDPQLDGNVTEGHGYKAYLDGPARPELVLRGVQ